MLNLKEKFKSYGFIMAVTGAVIIFLQSLASAFGFQFDEAKITYIVDGICGVFIVLGVVVKGGPSTTITSETENSDEVDEIISDEEKETKDIK